MASPARRSQLLYLIVAVAVALFVAHRVPYGWYVAYPFTLLATWVHECGHALAAVLCGGHVFGLHIYASTAGDAVITSFGDWRDGAVCAAGLIAPPVTGALLVLVAAGQRRATAALLLCALLVAATTLLLVRSLFGGLVLGGLSVVLALVAVRGGPGLRLLTAQLLSVELGLDWIARVDYFFTDHLGDDLQRSSDVATLARATGGVLPYWAWGAILAAFSSLVMVLALRRAIRRAAESDRFARAT